MPKNGTDKNGAARVAERGKCRPQPLFMLRPWKVESRKFGLQGSDNDAIGAGGHQRVEIRHERRFAFPRSTRSLAEGRGKMIRCAMNRRLLEPRDASCDRDEEGGAHLRGTLASR